MTLYTHAVKMPTQVSLNPNEQEQHFAYTPYETRFHNTMVCCKISLDSLITASTVINKQKNDGFHIQPRDGPE